MILTEQTAHDTHTPIFNKHRSDKTQSALLITEHNKSSAVAEMGDSLATINIAKNWERLCPLFPGGELDPHLTQSRLGRGLPPYQVAS